MKKFRVVVEGNNYRTGLDHKSHSLGFHTTRFIEAKDYITARMQALELVVEELDHIVFHNPDAAPHIDVSQLDEVESFAGYDVPGSGFDWYQEGS